MAIKKILILTILPVTNVLASAQWSVQPLLTQSLGSNWYTLQVVEPVKDAPESLGYTEIIGRSELEYPLDVGMLGLELAYTIEAGSQAYLRLFKNLNQPGAPMLDSDWIGTGSNGQALLYKFSYTESRSQVDWLAAESGLQSRQLKLFGRSFRLGVQLRVEYSWHQLYGVTGWQKFPDSNRVEFSAYQNEKVLTYQLWLFDSSVFLSFPVLSNEKIEIESRLFLSPLVYALDLDDHVLRRKTSQTQALGGGLRWVNYLQWRLSKSQSLYLHAGLRFVYTAGEMKQRFYGDDPGTPENDTGEAYNGIDASIALFTQELGMGWQYRF